MGATSPSATNWIEARAPARPLEGVDLDFNHIPDAAMTLAVAALFADGPSTLRNIGSWRVKETDRIAAMATELRKLGATVEEGADFLRITPPARLRPGRRIDTYDDHRMAMCFSLAALGGVRGADQRSGLRAQDLSRITSMRLRGSPARPELRATEPACPAAGHRHRRTVGLGQGHGRRSGSRRRSGFHYLDSGALYRLVALAALRAASTWTTNASAGALAAATSTSRFAAAGVLLDGQRRHRRDPHRGGRRRAPRGSPPAGGARGAARAPAGLPAPPGLVADGRDMGTVVFPGRRAQGFPDREPRGAGAAPT